MNQTLENGSLLEQVERLHKDVRKSAENMAILYNIEKNIDQKTTVIGRALVNQKQIAERVEKNQSAIEQQIADCASYAGQRQQVLQTSVEDLLNTMQGFKDLESREDTLLNSLNRLSKNQASFMKANLSMAKTAQDDLQEVKNTVKELQSILSTMDINDQNAFMEKKVQEIQTALNNYVDLRNKVALMMEQQVTKTKEQVTAIREKMEEQKVAIMDVAAICKSCEEKTNSMCARLEQLLAEKKTKVEEGVSLEDMFAAPVEDAFEDLETILPDAAKEEENTFEGEIELEEVFGEIPEKDEVEEISEESLTTDSKEIPELEYGYDVPKGVENDPAYKARKILEEKKQKKGFFDRLFKGGA